jgi:cystathionine beta-lyase
LKENDFFIDFEDLERSLSLPENKMLIFCSPHNPSGRVWSFEEVERVTELCIKYNKILVSDEIFGEMTFKGVTFTSCSSISD